MKTKKKLQICLLWLSFATFSWKMIISDWFDVLIVILYELLWLDAIDSIDKLIKNEFTYCW